MNRILLRIAVSTDDLITDLINLINPKLEIIIKKTLSNKELIKLQSKAKDINDFYNEVDILVGNTVYDVIYDNKIKLPNAKVKNITKNISIRELYNILYNSAIEFLKDNVIYPIVHSFLFTITSAEKLFKILKEKNKLNDFIIDFIKASPILNAKLKKVLIQKQISPTLKFLISNNILTSDEENCQVINKGLVKDYQDILSEAISNGWNKIEINLSNNELKKFLSLIKNIDIDITDLINNHIQLIQRSINNNTIFSPEELDTDNIKIGQTVKIDELFHDNTHSLNAKPALYFNGNMIFSNTSGIKLNTDTQRIYHKSLLDSYLGNESLHTNDIIKKPISEWRKMKNVENSLIYIFSGEYEAASIIIYKNVILFYGLDKFVDKVKNQLSSYKKPIFHILDNGLELIKVAKKLISKILITRIY